MSTEVPVQISPMRRIDLSRDVLSVAQLIETCFADELDDDGRAYLAYLRRMARDRTLLEWLRAHPERLENPLNGYVWVEEGKIVGNVTMVPYRREGRPVTMIANVAVLPEYRRRGIARQLTQQALRHARERGSSAVWLQVRDDNLGAIHLYETLGFGERARRTTWIVPASPLAQEPDDPGASLGRRGRGDWRFQSRWLDDLYPAEIRWGLGLDIQRFRPTIATSLGNWLGGTRPRHWAARRRGQLLGLLTWESSVRSSDDLWLATSAEHEQEFLRFALPRVAALVPNGRSKAINYPAGRDEDTLSEVGLKRLGTLIWMELPL